MLKGQIISLIEHLMAEAFRFMIGNESLNFVLLFGCMAW